MKQYSELENNVKRFIVEHEKGISIDDIHHKFRMKDGQNRKMADYLINNKKIILEMKSLFSDRVKNVNDKLNELGEKLLYSTCSRLASTQTQLRH